LPKGGRSWVVDIKKATDLAALVNPAWTLAKLASVDGPVFPFFARLCLEGESG
jgi:hypothetical protein